MKEKINDFILSKYIYIILCVVMFITPFCSLFLLVLLFFSKNKVNKYFIGACISFCIAYFAYHTVPLQSDDLYRHYDVMDNLKNVSITECFKFGYEGVPLNTLIMYFFAWINLPNLYTFSFVYVGFMLVLILFALQDSSISAGYKFLVFVFVIFEMFPRFYISGLRNHLTYIVLAYCIISYYFGKMNPKSLILVFGICLLIHSSTILVAAFFVFYEGIFKRMNSSVKTYLRIMMLFVLPVLMVLALILKSIITDLHQIPIIYKLCLYTDGLFFVSNTLQYMMLLCMLIVNMYLISCVRKNNRQEKCAEYNEFYYTFFFYFMAFIPNMNYLIRLSYIVSVFSIPVFLQFYKCSIGKVRLQLINIVLILLIIALLLFNFRNIIAYPWYFDRGIIKLLFPVFVIF